jgi:hypothetical protein
MFPILVTSLFEDCQDNIQMNYLTFKIYYSDEYNQQFIAKQILLAGSSG